MKYLTTPSTEKVREAMRSGQLGPIMAPQSWRKMDFVAEMPYWAADNGCFSDKYVESKWWAWLQKCAAWSATCLFAVAPDVVSNHEATLKRSLPWVEKMRSLGFPVAIVAQNGITPETTPWDQLDVLFLGGSPECEWCDYVQHPASRGKRCPLCGRRLTEWKLSAMAVAMIRAAQRRGKGVHAGRVNSASRFASFSMYGVDSCDGTYIKWGPDKNLPIALSWVERSDLFTIK